MALRLRLRVVLPFDFKDQGYAVMELDEEVGIIETGNARKTIAYPKAKVGVVFNPGLYVRAFFQF
jgi:hypothetical protein